MKTYGEKKYQSQNEKSDITQSTTYLVRYKQVLDFLVTVGGISITSSTSSSSDPLGSHDCQKFISVMVECIVVQTYSTDAQS